MIVLEYRKVININKTKIGNIYVVVNVGIYKHTYVDTQCCTHETRQKSARTLPSSHYMNINLILSTRSRD